MKSDQTSTLMMVSRDELAFVLAWSSHTFGTEFGEGDVTKQKSVK